MSARDVVAAALDEVDEDPVCTSNRRIADAIMARLHAAGLVVEHGWHGIDSATRDGTPVIIGCARTQSQRWAVWSGGIWRDGQQSAGGRISGVPAPTHWRPLPAPPEAKQ